MRLLLLTVLLLGLEASGASPELEKAKKLYGELKYKEADAAIDAAWNVAGNDREEVLTLLQLRGIVSASLGNGAKARDAFSAMLAIEPSRKLPDDLSPRVMTSFYEARGRVIDLGKLEAKAAPPVERNGQVEQVTVEVNDPVSIAAKARFHLRTSGGWTDSVSAVSNGKASAAVNAPHADWWVELLSAQQGVLFKLGSASAPLSAGSTAAPPPPAAPLASAPPSEPPLTVSAAEVRHPYRPFALVALGAGVVAAGAGVVLGLHAQDLATQLKPTTDAQGRVTNLTQKQAFDLTSQQRTSAIAANALYGVAGVAAVAGVLLWLFGPEEPAVALAPSLGGVTLVGRF